MGDKEKEVSESPTRTGFKMHARVKLGATGKANGEYYANGDTIEELKKNLTDVEKVFREQIEGWEKKE